MFIKLLLLMTTFLLVTSQGIFFPYGETEGDEVLRDNDDEFSDPIHISTDFMFFASTYTTLYVNTNGVLSFNGGVSTYTPHPFPVANQPLIAVFWGDVDTTDGGNITYREVTDTALLQDISDVILDVYAPRGLFYFSATWGFIATYDAVARFGSSDGLQRNTFQVVLASDGTHSFTIFNYGTMEWTYGTASGTVDAQVGFDAGDNVNYFAVPASRTPDIIHINETSNIDTPGRWMFRIDQATIDAGGCEAPGNCAAHEEEQPDASCTAIAPEIQNCPVLRGPVLVDDTYVYFYCEFTQDIEPGDVFQVHFLFNNEPDGLSPALSLLTFVSETRDVSFALHEKYLRGHLNTWVSCEVTSSFSGDTVSSQPIRSEAYWIGITPSAYEITVRESDDTPVEVHLISTIPIPCQQIVGGVPQDCLQRFIIHSSDDLMVYQPGRPGAAGDDAYSCAYYMYMEDWNEADMRSFRADIPLQVITIRTAFNEPDLVDYIRFSVDAAETKLDEDNTAYEPFWIDYEPDPIVVYRVDSELEGGATCAATGDPRVSKFDGGVFSMYATGQFTMVLSSSSRVFEIQIRTYECAQTLSCVCAVAAREGNEALILDMCDGDSVLATLHSIVRFAPGAPETQLGSITMSTSGTSYTITMESGAFVNVDIHSWGMNVLTHVLGQDYEKTSGLCGTFNNDRTDDYLIRDTDVLDTSDDLDAFVNSWRIPEGESFFEVDPDFVTLTVEPPSSFCDCSIGSSDEIIPCGGVVDRGSFSLLTNIGIDVQVFLTFTSPTIDGPPVRRKREITDSSLPVDPTYDPTQFTYAEDSNNIRNFIWPTNSGITETDATAECARILGAVCHEDQTIADTSIVVEKCVLDVKETDSYDWVQDKISEAQFTCIESTIRAVNVTIDENSDVSARAQIAEAVSEAVQSVVQNICPAQCSGNGDCVNSLCTCGNGWTGVDCSIDASSQPDVDSFMNGDVCDSVTSSCDAVRVQVTSAVSASPELACQIVVVESGETLRVTANFQGAFTVTCTSLPDPAALYIDLSTTSLTYQLSISRDGTNFGAAANYKVYNSDCTLCLSADQQCSTLDGTCSIQGSCHNDGDVNPDSHCDACIPGYSQNQWGPNPANLVAYLTNATSYVKLENEVISVEIEATDPDGNDSSIRFTLDAAQEGISLTSYGVLTWSSTANSDTTVVVRIMDDCDVINYGNVDLTIIDCPCAGINSYCVAQNDLGQGQYDCLCVDGFEGQDCSVDILRCASNPCVNGDCVEEIAGYTCTCDAGFDGDLCEINTDECANSPCINGECTDGVAQFVCTCDDGYEGEQCDTNTDDCADGPCINGVCTDGVAQFTCTCNDGFVGALCDRNLDACFGNEVAQLTSSTSYVKILNEEISVQLEATDQDGNDAAIRYALDTSSSDVTLTSHGVLTWISSANSDITLAVNIIDDCDGINDVTIDLSVIPCPCQGQHSNCEAQNADGQGQYDCICDVGYEGENCGVNIDDCVSSSCVHGLCVDGVAQYTCSCDAGYDGDLCDANIDECASDPCHMGQCTDGTNGYLCTCNQGYTGIHCDVNINECSSNPCVNGLCIDDVNSYTCSCQDNFEGTHCETSRVGWGEWGAYSSCSTTCDPGLQTRSRTCMLEDTCTGETMETRACTTSVCSVDDEEQSNMVEIIITSSTLTQVVQLLSHILQVVANSVNTYCDDTSPAQCCRLVDAYASTNANMRIFSANNVRIARGSVTEHTDGSITLGLIVEVPRSRLQAVCSDRGFSKRAVATVYITDDVLTEALTDSIAQLRALGLDVTIVTDDDDDDDDSDDDSDDDRIIGIAVGVAVAGVVVVGVLIACYFCCVRSCYSRSSNRSTSEVYSEKSVRPQAKPHRLAFLPWTIQPSYMGTNDVLNSYNGSQHSYPRYNHPSNTTGQSVYSANHLNVYT